jgi:hypothetical protein
MKKLIIAVVFVVSMTGVAKDRKDRPKRAEMEKFTLEQSNQLMLKKITLELELSVKQQGQMKSIIVGQTAKRESRMKERKANKDLNSQLSSDERVTRKSQMLDEHINMKAKMKNILPEDQFEKWNTMKSKQETRRSERMQKKRGDRMDRKKDIQK